MGKAAGKGKERWPQVRLGDVCTITMGQSPESSSYNDRGDGLPFYQGNADFGNLHPTTRYWCSRPKKLADINDVLISVRAPIGAVNLAVEKCCIGRGLASITAKNNCSDFKYLYYALISKTNELNVKGTGSTFKAIKKTTLEETQIPLPPLPEQRRIAAVLDQVSSLIALRKAQLAKLDLLVKARFVEMFGDPVKNEMGWNIVSLDEIAEISSGITKGRKTKEQDLKKVPYLSVSNVKDGYIDVSHVKTILATQNEIKQYKLLPYDVLMTEGGDPDKLGRGAILYQPPENCIHQNHIFRVRFDKNKINPVFFEEYLKHPAAKKYFLKCAKQTTGIATINMKQLSSLPVLLPPLEHQHVFSQFKQDTLKLKLAYNQTLEKLEILMKSLSLEYFG